MRISQMWRVVGIRQDLFEARQRHEARTGERHRCARLDRQSADLDKPRVGVIGGSYGGFMSLAVQTTYNDRIKAGIDIVGISNFVTFLQNTQGYRRDLRRAEYGDDSPPRSSPLAPMSLNMLSSIIHPKLARSNRLGSRKRVRSGYEQCCAGHSFPFPEVKHALMIIQQIRLPRTFPLHDLSLRQPVIHQAVRQPPAQSQMPLRCPRPVRWPWNSWLPSKP